MFIGYHFLIFNIYCFNWIETVLNMLSEIVSNNKIKILPMEFTETENYFYDQLEEWKRTIFHYDTMIGVIKKSQKSQPKLLIQ